MSHASNKDRVVNRAGPGPTGHMAPSMEPSQLQPVLFVLLGDRECRATYHLKAKSTKGEPRSLWAAVTEGEEVCHSQEISQNTLNILPVPNISLTWVAAGPQRQASAMVQYLWCFRNQKLPGSGDSRL